MVVDTYSECTLNELEGIPQNINEYESGLAQQCLAARAKKIKDLSISDFRVLLSQGMGLDYIVSFALNFVEENPLISSGLYKGDLLLAILKIPENFWNQNPDLNNRLMEIKVDIEEILSTLSEDILALMENMGFK